MIKNTTEGFIGRLRVTHGDKYDYSKIEYVNPKIKIKIICPIHGEFEQKPYNHLRGDGCGKCNGGVSKTKKDFIKSSEKKHGNKYDYSKVKYVNNTTPVTIGCPIHGEFKQKPNKHLTYSGCPKCSKSFLDRDYFIERSKKIHNNLYDYSKVEYVNNVAKVIIICPIHGEFKQSPSSHLYGRGCTKCSGHYMDTEFFIERAREVHGDRYDYSKSIYVNQKTNIIIICSIHGEFGQTSSSHFGGSGCPKCVGRNKSIDEFIKISRDVLSVLENVLNIFQSMKLKKYFVR